MCRAAIRLALAATAIAAFPAASPAQDATRASAPAAEDVLVTLKRLLDAPAPNGLTAAERAEYVRHTAWIQDAYQRIVTARDRATGMATGRRAGTTEATSGSISTPRDAATGQATGKRQHGAPNTVLAKLTSDLEQEARQFNTLSNASKARHDIALNAIRNMK